MQIRLTVLGPRSGRAQRACDVLITAPAGTALSAVAGALASAAGSGQPGRSAGSSVALFAGPRRLPPTAPLGVPPLVDGALLSLHAPAEPQGGHAADHGQYGQFGQYGQPPAEAARLHVVGGPDAGGVHLLQGGQARIGRSADADVPLDDPDVSRLHCEVAFGPDGVITVADLDSTNGTTLAGRPVGPRPQPFPPGALLRIGESTLRLETGAPAGPTALATVADADGHLRISLRAAEWDDTLPAADPSTATTHGTGFSTAGVAARAAGPGGADGHGATAPGTGQYAGGRAGANPRRPADGSGAPGPAPSYGPAPTTGWGPPAPGTDLPEGDGPEPAADPHGGEPPRWTADAADGYGDVGSGDGGIDRDDDAFGSGRRATGERRAPGIDSARRGGGGVVGSIGAWARRRLGGTKDVPGGGEDGVRAEALRERWPDPAAVLLTALGPGRRLWERGPGHPDALTVRLGTADLPAGDGRRLTAVPVTVDLRAPRSAALTLAGPRPRLAGLARAVLAQLCALHSPAALELVMISADRARTADQRAEEWSWLNWVPHVRPAHGQDCRLLLAFDRDQAEARAAELMRRLEAGPLGAGWATATAGEAGAAAAGYDGPYTLLVVDGDPGSATLRQTVARLAVAGPSVGVHVLCLAESGERPAVDTGVLARLSGDVATTLRVEPAGAAAVAGPAGHDPAAFDPAAEEIVLDAVSAAWAEHFARALAPLREADGEAAGGRSRHAPPAAVRLLDELDLALATPARIAERWAAAPAAVGAATAVLGAGADGRVAVDLVTEGPHAMIGGAPGSGKTELLRSVAAALAAGERPDRLSLVLVDGAGQDRGEGLRACADLPHVSTHLVASDPLRMREFAQALGAELKRRAELLDGQDFASWHADRLVAATVPHQGGPHASRTEARTEARTESVRTDTARTESARGATAGGDDKGAVTARTRTALPRLVVVVDDFDELVAPGLGSTGRPAAGSVVRALEAVAREGARLGVHLIASTGRPERTAATEADERSRLRIALRMPDAESAALLVHVEDPAGLDESVPGRGYLRRPGGAVTAFQAGRVSGRIPRTATLRPTVVALEWERMGDPPARRQVRELGNGPTDLALLASALQRAAESAPEESAPAPVTAEDAATSNASEPLV
ncbi:FHA domain-containing protein [Actinacidiphila alni]|uniref:FHA domain-containing protein n=1 Tax=Actinacidiphila alni TaxID=380248 RepID=A0A1I2M5S3_9ACTN|nr:FtsK/SpoIIIE domain-containing protein [Actinacidiphila alni]SFF86873.1 FHA domain-containing protein [Actinacidiphila alni]